MMACCCFTSCQFVSSPCKLPGCQAECQESCTSLIGNAVLAAWNSIRKNGTGNLNAIGAGAVNTLGTAAIRTTFAGFILLAISNALLILSMGTDPHHRDAQHSAPVATGPGAAGVQSTRNLAGGTTPLEGGRGQTVV